jgi:sec-independent protein translocase protein TatA
MFGRLGWAEILIIVVLVAILFGHNKIPTMMKNLANGLNVFKKELKTDVRKSDKKKKGEKK